MSEIKIIHNLLQVSGNMTAESMTPGMDRDRQTTIAMVAALGSIYFLDQITSFLREIDGMRTGLL